MATIPTTPATFPGATPGAPVPPPPPVEVATGGGGEAPTWAMHYAELPLLALREAPEYARHVREHWVDTLQQDWDDLRATVLFVSLRANGNHYIIGGRHRGRALRQRLEQGKVPGGTARCLVYTGLTLKEEAIIFHSMDTDRITHSAGDQVPALRLMEYPRTLHIDAILKGLGLELDHLARSGSHSPTIVGAVAALQQCYDLAGPDRMRHGLWVIREAWVTPGRVPDLPQGTARVKPFTADAIRAVVGCLIRYDHPDVEPRLDVKALIASLRRVGPEGFKHGLAAERAANFAHTAAGERAGMRAVVMIYNHRRAKDRQLDIDLVLRRVNWWNPDPENRAGAASARSTRAYRRRQRERARTARDAQAQGGAGVSGAQGTQPTA